MTKRIVVSIYILTKPIGLLLFAGERMQVKKREREAVLGEARQVKKREREAGENGRRA